MHMRAWMVSLVALIVSVASSRAAPPGLINYQGRLTDGTNLVQGVVALELNLYTDPGAVLPVYRDTGQVSVVDGLYTAYLGDGTALGSLAEALTNEALYLEVVVNGTPLSPRERMVSVPYALSAGAFNEMDPRWALASTGYYTRTQADALFATGMPVYAEGDPLWAGASNLYYLKTQSDALFATGLPVYVESDPVWLLASTGYFTRGESLALFATGTPLYVETDATWAGASNLYYLKAQADALFATGLPVYAESDPVWLLASTGYFTRGEALALFATGTPLYVETDATWTGASNLYYLKAQADVLFATGLPVYAESDPVWLLASTGYFTRGEALALFATGTPLYVETDATWTGASNLYYLKAQADVLFATGLPLYAESDPVWLLASTDYFTRGEALALFATGAPVYVESNPGALLTNGTRAMAANLNMGGRAITNLAVGGLVFTNGQSVTQLFVKVAGDTMTGRLNLPAGGLAVASTQLVVLTNGFVGIGTAAPTNHLAVNGSIKAREVIVTPDNWPDYVFAPAYRLMPLTEVEAFIRQNGHLPGVPSAQAVGRDGIALGEMQQHLLRKVEELTLYVIELRKENEALRKALAPNQPAAGHP